MPAMDDRTRKLVEEELRKLQQPVKVLFFSQEIECGYCADARRLLSQVAEMNRLITLEIFDLLRDPAQVKKYNIERIPAVVVLAGEDDFGFRYYGLPTGYEFSVLINILVMASRRDSGLLPQYREELKKIINPLVIKVFVLPTCPHCPAAAFAAGRFAFENRNVKTEVIETAEFPHLVQKYGVTGTPKVVINDTVSFDGALPEPLFIQYLLHAQDHLLAPGPGPSGTDRQPA